MVEVVIANRQQFYISLNQYYILKVDLNWNRVLWRPGVSSKEIFCHALLDLRGLFKLKLNHSLSFA